MPLSDSFCVFGHGFFSDLSIINHFLCCESILVAYHANMRENAQSRRPLLAVGVFYEVSDIIFALILAVVQEVGHCSSLLIREIF